jgi:hypothetical protein
VEPAPQVARNGRHVLKFVGTLLGSATSARWDAARWSELAVYGLANGSYIHSKVGRSRVVHRPDCGRVDYHMTAWIDLPDDAERQAAKMPCPLCQPAIGASWDPQTMIESTRYTATVVSDPELLARLLTAGRTGKLPFLVTDVITQVCANDPVFRTYWLGRIAAPSVARFV